LSILRIVLRITAFEPVYRDGVARICAAEGWTSWTAENVLAAFSAPSVIGITALEGDEISGVAQLLTDGRVMAYLGLLIVDRHAAVRASAGHSSTNCFRAPGWPGATCSPKTRRLASTSRCPTK
jgi:hypothetical protein